MKEPDHDLDDVTPSEELSAKSVVLSHYPASLYQDRNSDSVPVTERLSKEQ